MTMGNWGGVCIAKNPTEKTYSAAMTILNPSNALTTPYWSTKIDSTMDRPNAKKETTKAAIEK